MGIITEIFYQNSSFVFIEKVHVFNRMKTLIALDRVINPNYDHQFYHMAWVDSRWNWPSFSPLGEESC